MKILYIRYYLTEEPNPLSYTSDLIYVDDNFNEDNATKLLNDVMNGRWIDFGLVDFIEPHDPMTPVMVSYSRLNKKIAKLRIYIPTVEVNESNIMYYINRIFGEKNHITLNYKTEDMTDISTEECLKLENKEFKSQTHIDDEGNYYMTWESNDKLYRTKHNIFK